MQPKKPSTKATDDELLKILESPSDVDVVINTSNDIDEFCDHWTLEPGATRVTRKALYSLYQLWSVHKLTEINFHKYISLILPYKFGCYHISKSKLEARKSILQYLFERQDKKTISKVDNKKYQNHFRVFLHDVCIEKGSNPVPIDVVSFQYRKWYYNKKKQSAPLSNDLLVRMFKKFEFTIQRDKVHLKDFCMSESEIGAFMESLERQRREKKQKKKQLKVPSVRPVPESEE